MFNVNLSQRVQILAGAKSKSLYGFQNVQMLAGAISKSLYGFASLRLILKLKLVDYFTVQTHKP